MDSGDVYKSLLASASHAQQQRHAQLHTSDKGHAVGNVFLPAIQKRSAVQSALSMKHLEVIEQCILAENRREEQLAKCQSDKERRYLTKKFIAQRLHERDLIQALTLGQPSEGELQIEDVTTEAYRSPLLAGARSPISRKLGPSTSPDKVIKMAGEKTFATTSPAKRHATKAVSPHFHGTASPERRRLADEEASRHGQHLSQDSPSKLTSDAASSPKRVRPSKSASPTQKTNPSPSGSSTRQRPTAARAEQTKLPHALATSPLRPSIRNHSPTHSSSAAKVTPSHKSSPSKAKISKPRRDVSSTATQGDDGDETIEFEGVTSFLEARQHAMALVHDRKGLVEGETQTTGRFDSAIQAADHSRQKYVLMLTRDDELSIQDGPRRRPHSSPEPRRRRPSAEAHLLPSLAPSHSDTSLRNVEFFHASEAVSGSVATYISDDRTKKIHMYPKENPPDAVVEQQLAWAEENPMPEQAEEPTATADLLTHDESTDEIDWDELEQRVREDMGVPEAAADGSKSDVATTDNDIDEEDLDGVGQEAETSVTEDDDAEEQAAQADLLLSLLYDMVHQIEDAFSHEQLSLPSSTDTTTEPGPDTRRAALVNFALFVTRIQSSFRGYRARKAFRLALYQEALQCGVLGAMPGTTQGHSGWYQDPKSYVAYYFVVQQDDEWVQKNVLRCTGLVLTPYQMHAQIWARIPPTDPDESADM